MISYTLLISIDAVSISATEAILPAAAVVSAQVLVAPVAAVIPTIAHVIFRLDAFPVLAGKSLHAVP